jgi:hypothetical protein
MCDIAVCSRVLEARKSDVVAVPVAVEIVVLAGVATRAVAISRKPQRLRIETMIE